MSWLTDQYKLFFFFFQAEDGIRDLTVTGVQTCALPISFWPEAKYATTAAPVRLSSGWEMRLLEAEAALVAGDTATARAKMNLRRTALTLPGVTFTNLTEAWTALKTERAIELWLEARRLGDLRRWIDNNVPGGYIDGTYRSSVADTLHATPLETMTAPTDRKSTRLNSSHSQISYAVFCLKKKKWSSAGAILQERRMVIALRS